MERPFPYLNNSSFSERRWSCPARKKRLVRLSERGLVELAKQGFLGRENLDKLEFRNHCILDKQHRVKFESGIHSDFWILL
ncbi:hypothetical protein MTR_8g006040 [Medicago truncatula]|uniref:Uncharacterized protein n=1 Tax=Medicago truncatula TaxID=3880 RepID=G7LBK5_MEDTR|nr:hypothetical protein MTR_8g006040 [Medicago truncatula]